VAIVLLAGAVLTLGGAGDATAQSARHAASSPDSVRLVADLFFRALADEKWETAASFLDTAMIRRMVAQQLRMRPEPGRRELTIDDFMRMDPNKPREVAEYELKRFREQMAKNDAGERFSHQYYGVRSVEDLRALTTTQAAVRFLQAKDQRMQFREFLRQSGCSDTTITAPFRMQRILATALANDSVAYVLHDQLGLAGSREGYSEFPTVMALRLREGRWKIIPSDALMGPGGVAVIGGGPCDSTQGRPRR
jgi:hypothetical protein